MDNFEEILHEIDQIKASCDYFVYGKSYLGQDLIAFHKGSYDSAQLLITAGMHAREYISTKVVLNLLKDYTNDEGCYFIPLTNPDGVRMVLDGIDWIEDNLHKQFLLRINNSADFSLWKANARAVDLNVNFDALWGKSKFIKNLPQSGGWAGENSNSELENVLLLDFIKNKQIKFSLAYHSKGEVVYYGFEKLTKNQLRISKKIGKNIAKTLNYKLIQSKNSSGGLSDYLSYKYNIPSFTIELGSDNLSHPITFEYFNTLYKN